MRIGLALGGGGARGLAHIPVLEVFDELGVRPAMIAGSSMGAMVGAAYASGIGADEIRDHALSVLGNPRSAARKILTGGEKSSLALLNFSLTRTVLVDGLALVDLFMPADVANTIEETQIPLLITATDFMAARELVLREGDLKAAVAASIAIPGVIAAPRLRGRLLIDGAITNPVPFDHLQEAGCAPVMAVEVTGQPRAAVAGRKPGITDLALGATQIMQLQIAALKRRLAPPDLWIDPPLDTFRAYDFLKVREILRAADSMRDEIRRGIEALCRSGSPNPPATPMEDEGSKHT